MPEGDGNPRHLPTTHGDQSVALLPQGQVPRVRTLLGGSEVIGHVALSRLEPAGAAPQEDAAPPATAQLPIAQLREDNTEARRDRTKARAFPIGEAGRPRRDLAAGAEARVAQLTALGDWLDVARAARWRPTLIATFCNVYAADYCYLARAYLPRVWWTSSALVRLGRGEAVPVVYAQTVVELRADDLLAWLVDMGPRFGWRRVFDAGALQAAANAGGLGLICADREAAGRAGHITVVVPETPAHRAERDADGNVTQPLQSQAGASNHRYGSAGPSWWSGSQFRDRGFFVHD
ncbi:hypothetical protein [Pseudorhodoferax sp. Leaf267]|uniref:hypothetical protein n=1 Tax=Pseudorhodoferax sp. Leaf267 TaxID=1736316 RepID=UPI0006FD0696|nr:hypothetical protein [Pseudorhodoferax sp. Leaf267]KQP21568.1 hypothetical protein ASF43_26810 [Pseudorhodoferax sp. Leaf267]